MRVINNLNKDDAEAVSRALDAVVMKSPEAVEIVCALQRILERKINAAHLLDDLEQIRLRRKLVDTEKGICCNVSTYVPRGYFETWEHYTGHPLYPVPDPEEELSACTAYHEKDKWAGTYGAYRWDLVRHLIDCCKEELKSWG